MTKGREGGGWGALLRGGNAARSAVVGGGMIIHAISTFIVTTILPSVVRDIGGLRFFAWSTTLYVVGSLVGGALCSRVLCWIGARRNYRLALGMFALGTAVCALAPSMPVLLAGRALQGLGAGQLSALSFTMVRVLFAESLWAPAISVVSAAWGVATLAGPAVGGLFAQAHAWRAAFWSVFALAPMLLALVERALPPDLAPPPPPRTRLATLNLAVLALSALVISAASSAPGVVANAAGLAASGAGLALFVALERRGGRRLLPGGATDPAGALGAIYAAQMTLIIGVTTEIFVSYFLQTLHGVTPLHAGYLTALMSGGWTVGSVAGAGASPARARLALRLGPLLLVAGLAGLRLLMPWPTHATALLWPIGVSLAAMGLGIGLAWPHLGVRVFAFAPEGEKDLAAASITMVIMVANALGSALGGMVTNLAGLTLPGGVPGATAASAWLFGLFLIAPMLAALAIRRVVSAAPSPR